LISRCLQEATRIVEPGGSILLHTNQPPVARTNGVPLVVFQVFRKVPAGSAWTYERLESETFRSRPAEVKDFIWQAWPIRLYRSLIEKYSRPGDTIAHVFSGSGNGAIAALELSRKPILVDLHYHRRIERRLRKKVEFLARQSSLPRDRAG
jgi:hypothetical protein